MAQSKKTSGSFKHAPHTAWRRVEKEAIVLDLNTSVYYSLNETGSFIWERLVSGATPAQVCEGLCAQFDVKPETAARDAAEIFSMLHREKLLIPA